MSKRKAEDTNIEMASGQEKISPKNNFNIGLAEPLKDYQKLIETKVQVDEIVDDEVIKNNFEGIAAAARGVIWQLLFTGTDGDGGVISESQQKASELLEEYKGDATFYDPWEYNKWIITLRDEVLKKELLDFWRNTIVKKQLGPCWSRDCDLFDSDDTPPVEFYAHAGCTAPFAASLKVRAANNELRASEASDAESSREAPEGEERSAERSADDEAAFTGVFDAVITRDQPLSEYRDLMTRFVLTDVIVPDEIQQASVKKIAKAAQDVIWQILFEGNPSQEDQDKAADLLQEYKTDSGFYGPWDYNEWIVKLRDEVLAKQLLDFWREKIVKLELGPCWSRDSDFFENDDDVPLEFYNKAGCKAPFNPPADT
ncbi:GL25983 [Drosophila persimilis]|uniref:GL25983 n=1 Tax=Drosophila persimilis TaxID=7234 RepID=B4GK03_DROPE|nr:uncharacterized protein LOC6593781 [Drosophila persimilis]EDW36969.1 GL25983 [Drosophila persimilis]